MAFVPTLVTELELAEPSPTIASRYTRARVLVRLLERPLGFVEVDTPDGEIDFESVRGHAASQFESTIHRRLGRAVSLEDPAALISVLSGAPRPFSDQRSPRFFSVVVSTRERPHLLNACLTSLQRLSYPNFEVIVVDNAPESAETRNLFFEGFASDPRFRYVVEPRRGLSNGRNCGLREARSDVVAFTDDDVEVDRYWLHALSGAFDESPDAACVTGLVPTAELETPAQLQFDTKVAWAESCERRRYTLVTRPLPNKSYPFAPGLFGTGANFAVNRAVMQDLGGFDPALGAGSPALGGEDLDAFVRVILAGYALIYEPAAIVWHHHRVDPANLQKQMFAYGLGFTAYLSKYMFDRRLAARLVRYIPVGAIAMARSRRHELKSKVPLRLVAIEALGMLRGPFVYAKAARALRRSTSR